MGWDKVYHATYQEHFKSILKEGALIPIAMKATSLSLANRCYEDLNQRYSDLPGPILQALREIIEERSKTYESYPYVGEPLDFAGHMHCFEFISGGSNFVYLNPYGWEPYFYEHVFKGKPWGFVFDAEDLISKGALTMRWPLESFLDDVFSKWNTSKMTKSQARAAIMDAVGRFNGSLEYGSEALKSLKKGYKRYVAWRGPLPIDEAIEIWVDGKRDRKIEGIIKIKSQAESLQYQR